MVSVCEQFEESKSARKQMRALSTLASERKTGIALHYRAQSVRVAAHYLVEIVKAYLREP